MSKKIIGVTVGSPLPKPNLLQTDPNKGDYVKGKEEFLKQVNTGATAEEAAQIAQNKQDIVNLKTNKLDASKLPEAVNEALAQAKASGDFKGEPGDDYVLTEADKQKIAELTAPLVEVPDGGAATMQPLTFTGAVNATYDGSVPVSVEIPQGGGGGEKPWRLLATIDFSNTENQIREFIWTDLAGVTDILMFINNVQNGTQTASFYNLRINGTQIAQGFAPSQKNGTTNYWWAKASYDGLAWNAQKSNGAIANNNSAMAYQNALFPYCIFKDVGKAESILLTVPNPDYKNVAGTWEIWVR